jgi:hypothetical protein
MSNRELWDRVCVTDPRAVKAITGKQYNGNSPKPYWIVERLTDEFGPCGIGWGFSIVSERFERFSDTDTLHLAVVRFWYVMGAERGELEQVGQTKATYMSSKDKFIVDEDAPKKSVTDALIKCASYLGFAGDIFAGRWDDSKYVEWAGAEWDKRTRPTRTDGLSWERVDELESMAADMLALQSEGREMAAVSAYYGLPSNEEKLVVWGFLKGPGGGSTPESRLRSLIKANQPVTEKAA